MASANQRRLLLLGGLAVIAGGWQIVPKVFDRFSDSFAFNDLDDPEGFRALERGEVSTALDIFAGLDGPGRDLTVHIAAIRTDIPKALFAGKTSDRNIQIAYFSDYYCPICRVLSSELVKVMGEGGIDVTWHETPIFGQASDIAARGAIAAGAQGRYIDFHNAMVRTPVVATPAFMAQMGERLGVEPNQFRADMTSAATQDRLDQAAALAQIFAFIGTPAMVVGRTVVNGRISPTNLRQLIARERSDGHIG